MFIRQNNEIVAFKDDQFKEEIQTILFKLDPKKEID